MVTAEELQSMLTLHGGHLTRVEVPPGWMDLVAECHKKLVRIYPEYKLYQVKEKFGGLRYYTGPIPTELSEKFNDVIRLFEEQSYKTCQVCGEPGSQLIIGTWYYTLCQEHGDATSEWRRNRWK